MCGCEIFFFFFTNKLRDSSCPAPSGVQNQIAPAFICYVQITIMGEKQTAI